MTKRAWLFGLLFLAGCHLSAPGPAIPQPVELTGGFLLPWTPDVEATWVNVLVCAGIEPAGAKPTIWVMPVPLSLDGKALAGVYLPEVHAILISSDAVPFLELVLRHEFIHSRIGDSEHTSHAFSLYQACQFWPPSN